MVPISAHALFARPMVVAPTSVLAVEVLARTEGAGVLWCDGRRTVDLPPGARIEVRRGARPVRLVRLHQAPFTDRLVAKFGLPVEGWRGSSERRRRLGRGRRCLRRSGSGRSGVIESSTLELGPGLTVITGETGAGKTMVVTALGLLLGGRADTGAVRTGAQHRAGRGRRPRRRPARVRRRGRGAPGERSRTTGWCSPATSPPRAARARSSAARRCPCRRSPRSPSRWSPCTASPTSTGCCRPAPSARRWTASAARTPRRCWRRYTDLLPAPRGHRARARRGRDHRPRAGPRGRPAAVRARRDRGRLPGARRGHRAGRRGVPARVRRHPAHRRRAGPRGALQRAGPARRPGHHLGRPQPRSTASATTTPRPASWPTGWPRSPTCSPTSPPTWRRTPPGSRPTRAGWPPSRERRAALTALTRKYGDTIDEVLAWSEQSANRLLDLDDTDERIDELRAEQEALRRRARRRGRRACPRPAPPAAGRLARRGHRRARPCWRCRTPGSRIEVRQSETAGPADGRPRPAAGGRPVAAVHRLRRRRGGVPARRQHRRRPAPAPQGRLRR